MWSQWHIGPLQEETLKSPSGSEVGSLPTAEPAQAGLAGVVLNRAEAAEGQRDQSKGYWPGSKRLDNGSRLKGAGTL